MSGPVFSLDELLSRADWLRRLAAHLTRGDAAGAEDAVQETWIAALRSPPGRDRAPEPWLAEVLRNFLRRAGRGERARQRREATAHQIDPGGATPEELLARAEAQRLLTDLVLALEEPFRATLLLRYFEGESAAAIARRLGIPAGTVRWRLKEGLARLRTRLDERQGRRWLALLLPLPAAGGAGLVTTGGLVIMAAKKKAILGALVLALALLAGGLTWRSSLRSAQAPTPAPTGNGPAARPPAFARAVVVPTGEVVTDESVAGSVEGVVRSAADGSPIAGAELAFAYLDSSLPSRTDEAGRFHFAPREPGTYLLARIFAEGFQAFSPEWGDSPVGFVLRPGERIRGVELTLRPAQTCRGRVLDEAGKPVAGARLQMWAVSRGTPAPAGSEVSDAGGAFELPAVDGVTVEAHEGGRMAREQLGAGLPPCQLTLRLGPARPAQPLVIDGRVERAGAPLAGIIVEAWANPVLERTAQYGFARATTDEQGRFSLTPLDGVAYEVSAHVGGREVATARGVRGGSREVLLRVPAGGRVRGQVKDGPTGAPVPRFSVVLSKAESAEERGRFGVSTRYDARGVFEIEDVPAGAYRVMVVADGRAPSEEQATTVAPEPAVPGELTFTLPAGGEVRGRVVDRLSKAPVPRALVALDGRAGITASVPFASQTLTGDDGRFTLRGVPPGRISLTFSAATHHGRILGGLDLEASAPRQLPDVDLNPRKEGEPRRIELVGIGASLAKKGDLLVFGQMSPEGGAAKAGLVPGDAVVALDGEPVAKLGFGAAIQRIRGAENTPLVLRVRHADGREEDVTVIRQLVRWPAP